ncbi:MAG TPA: DUF1761 domain-containing protein [Tepidisphaeraceae bacterium]|jgi:hypothetical protein|nr:DUF1761 domain-containing protein [Tepidisphaeraceae bacterium]
MYGINVWAILLAAASSFMLGGVWYSPALFGPAWNRADGGAENRKTGHPARVFGASIVLAVIAAGAFAFLLGPEPPLGYAVTCGLVVGLGIVAASFGINYSFANRNLRLWLIDGGYHATQFMLFGVVLGLWH